MKEKVIFISEPEIENEELYQQYARKKIKITYLKNDQKYVKNDYIDNPNSENYIESYKTYLKEEKRKIHVDSLEKTFKIRVIANIVAFLLSTGEFLVISGVGNMISNSAMLNPAILSNVGLYLSVGASLVTFWKFNQKKNYFTEKQIQNLERLEKELDKCNNLDKEFTETKEKREEFEYQRLQIANSRNRERNLRRNYNMKQDENRRVFESNQRVAMKAEEDFQRQQEAIDNSRFRRTEMAKNLRLYEEDLDTYRRSRIVKRNNFKKVLKSASNWIMEGFVDEDYSIESRSR